MFRFKPELDLEKLLHFIHLLDRLERFRLIPPPLEVTYRNYSVNNDNEEPGEVEKILDSVGSRSDYETSNWCWRYRAGAFQK